MDQFALGRVATAIARYLPPGTSPTDVARIALEAVHAPPSGAELIAAERVRQIIGEGWTPEHDLGHPSGHLALAGRTYLTVAAAQLISEAPAATIMPVPPDWPFDADWWKPGTVDRNLIRAGALIAAEIDRSAAQHRPHT